MVKYERIPTQIHEKYISWKGGGLYARKNWLDKATIAEDYYYNDVEGTGTTFTQEQYNKIVDNTNIPVNINFLHPVIKQKLAILMEAKGSFKVISQDGRAKVEAQVLDKMKHAILYESNTQIELEEMVKDMLVSGMGHIMISPTDFYQPGVFNLSILHVPYDEVILDINAKRRTCEDMEGFFIEKAFTLPKLAHLYGDILAALKDENGNPVNIASFTGQVWIEDQLTPKQDIVTTNWNVDQRVIVREYYEKVFTNLYLVKTPDGSSQYMFAENLDPIEQSILNTAEVVRPDTYIKKTLMFGDFCVWQEVMPITEYPLKTAFFEWGGKPYRSFGMVHFTKSMQEAFDKVLSIMILNGILQNNAGWVAPKGAILDEDKANWENGGADPRVIKEFVVKTYDGKPIVPERDRPEQLSNFYPLVLDMLKSNIEYSTGITSILQGNAKDSNVEVFSSLQQYQNAAMMRIILSTFHINETLRQIGQTLIQLMISNLRPDHFEFFDDRGDLNEVQIAQDMINSMRQFKFQLITIPSTAMPSQRLAAATELMKIAQSSPDPNERQILTQKAMELSEIKEYETVKDQLDAVKNAQSKLQGLQEAYNRLLETSKQMENKYINIALENRILKGIADKEKAIEGTYAALEAKLQLADQLANKQIAGEQKPQQE